MSHENSVTPSDVLADKDIVPLYSWVGPIAKDAEKSLCRLFDFEAVPKWSLSPSKTVVGASRGAPPMDVDAVP